MNNDSLLPSIGLGFTFILAAVLLVSFFRLRVKLRNARGLMEKMATTDELTGILNRKQLMTRFEEEFHEHKRQKSEVACILVDLDHLKKINETYGHSAGDSVLKEFARVTKSFIRIYDVFGRYGGEEFMILIPFTGLPQAMTLAERIRKTIAEKFTVKSGSGDHIRLTVSLGVTSLREGDESIDVIAKRADEALTKAKQAGRNRAELA